MEGSAIPRIPLQLSRDCVVASVQIDLRDEILRQFQTDLLEYIHATGASGVIIDVSGVEIMDAEDFDALRRTLAMSAIMGTRPVIVGLRPGVVSSLVELGADPSGIDAALNLDEGFALLDRLGEVHDEVPEDEVPEDDTDMISEDRLEGSLEAEFQDEPGHDPDSHRE